MAIGQGRHGGLAIAIVVGMALAIAMSQARRVERFLDLSAMIPQTTAL